MEQVPHIIVDYASGHGYTGVHVAGRQDGIIYYQLYRKSKSENHESRKVGLPVIVRLKGDDIVRVTGDSLLVLMKDLSIL